MTDSAPALGSGRRQRLASYALVVRDDAILLSRLAPRISATPLWTLPGGGVAFGEDPREAVVREVYEETGLAVTIDDTARVYSAHFPATEGEAERHAVRLVFEGWVPRDAPAPQVVEVDGSTVEAAWVPLDRVESGEVPLTATVREALADYRAARRQRLAAYGLATDGHRVLLTRIADGTTASGLWTLPGGGVEHGERPSDAVRREIAEECGLEADVGDLLGVDDVHFTGTAPSGRTEDYHGVHLVFAVTVPVGAVPRVTDPAGTTDAAAWLDVAEVRAGTVPVTDLVVRALDLAGQGDA